MDSGAPTPRIVASDNELFVSFFLGEDSDPNPPGGDYGLPRAHIRFQHCIKHTFGFPNDETLHGHLYYGLGLSVMVFMN